MQDQTCIYWDPFIVDYSPSSEFRLTCDLEVGYSKCIDEGHNPGALYSGYADVPTIDKDGNPRPVDIPGVGHNDDDILSDMGAYEAQHN